MLERDVEAEELLAIGRREGRTNRHPDLLDFALILNRGVKGQPWRGIPLPQIVGFLDVVTEVRRGAVAVKLEVEDIP